MIQELVRAAADGDREAVRKLAELAAQGNQEALDALANGFEKPAEDEHEDPERFLADLRLAKSAATSTPAAAEGRLKALAVRARRLGTCEQVHVLGLDAVRLMFTGALDEAGHRLSQAQALERQCRQGAACALLNRRRASLLALSRGDFDLALREAQAALTGYEALGSPGHDLNGDGLASALTARAESRFHLADYAGSAGDFAAALERFSPSAKVWSVTQQNLARALVHTGGAGRRAVAESEQFAALRLSMRRGNSIERAAFLWLDGQLWLDQDKRRDRGFKRLRRAMVIYAHPLISAPDPFLNVASDIAQAMISCRRYPDRGEIAAFLELEVGPIAKRIITDDLHHERLQELFKRCKARPGLSVWVDLRLAIESLRSAAERSIPCLLGWPPWLNLPPGRTFAT